jgi:tRNA modification GTPase
MIQSPATIFALSSGHGTAAIAVIRISGPRAGAALTALGVKIPEPRKAGFARIRDPQSGEVIDEALALWFPGPKSETGEDVAELQPHGGRAVIAAVLAALSRVEGLRMAEPGEFTRRGFENGKLDLTAVEGLADLVMAETEGQRRQALRQMQGALGKRAEDWRQQLIQALALVEARIDFSDEGDVPEHLVEPALTIARTLAGEIEAALADGRRGERLREGMVVAIAGPPNAGKSTLLNRIARREAAIVSPYAGTTRDVIEVHLDLGSWPVTLLDTAGVRPTADPVEMEGVRRARERAAAADLVLWVEDASAPGGGEQWPGAERSANGLEQGGRRSMTGNVPTEIASADGSQADMPRVWIVRNKIDLVAKPERLRNERFAQFVAQHESNNRSNNSSSVRASGRDKRSNESIHKSGESVFNISTTSGEGLDALLGALLKEAELFLGAAEPGLVTRERHRKALEDTASALRRAADLGGREDLLAEELRVAAHSLGRLTGRVDVEDILDVIFRDFCIGK